MKNFIDSDSITVSDLRSFLDFCDSNLTLLCECKSITYDSALYGLLKASLCSINLALNHVDEFKK